MMEINSERSRIRAALVNSGRYGFTEADQKLASSALTIVLAEDIARSPAGQAAFLTAVVTAARCFGMVAVQGAINVPLLVPLPVRATTLLEAAVVLGAAEQMPVPLIARAVRIGPVPPQIATWSIQAFWNGWKAGVSTSGDTVPTGRGDCVIAGVAAGALAVGQAFLAEQGDPRAGLRQQEISLWSLGAEDGSEDEAGPQRVSLPLGLWFIGLGNLGQAYLWTTSLLPYPEPERVNLFFQDDDRIGRENWGTSVLVEKGKYGARKTRVAEDWADDRRFEVTRIDRNLDAATRRTPYEPTIALSGLDSMPGRRLLGVPGFDFVIDAGLGATVDDYQKFRMNVFAGGKKPDAHFSGQMDDIAGRVQKLMSLPAYRKVSEAMSDGGCGSAMLAEQSVAVPFVSAFVGALVVTQAIRIASGAVPLFSVTGRITDLRGLRTALGMEIERCIVSGVEVDLRQPRQLHT